TEESASASAAIRLESDGAPIPFRIDANPNYDITANPTVGVTPVDVTVKVAPAVLSNGHSVQFLPIRGNSVNGGIINIPVNIDVVLPGYVGEAQAMSLASERFPVLAPGSLFYINLAPPVFVPADPAQADPDSLVNSLAGYS